MKMKYHVTSIEQSRRLLELGVPAEKASMVWGMDEDCARLNIWNTDEETRRVLHHKYPDYYYPAFTVVDLLEMMPGFIGENKSLFIERRSVGCSGSKWCIGYRDGVTLWIGSKSSLLDVCTLGIEWLLSNGYKLEL